MMAGILLGVLCFSGCFISSTHVHHQYHYVPVRMNWTQAQSYCRQNYTDLATIESIEEVNHVVNLSSAVHSAVWTGLYSHINWTWSNGNRESGTYNGYWAFLKYFTSHHWCLSINKNSQLSIDACSAEYLFICYNGTHLDPEFVFVNKTMSWSSAQSYCRENFVDLATVKNDTEQQKVLYLVQNLNMLQNEDWMWTGLNGYFNASPPDGSDSRTFLWDYAYFIDLDTPAACSMMDLAFNTLALVSCTSNYTFICYSTPPPTTAEVRRAVVRLRIKASVDPNDPAVKAEMIKQLQDRLQEKGVSGVQLWREHPDGEVFHKERNDQRKTEL